MDLRVQGLGSRFGAVGFWWFGGLEFVSRVAALRRFGFGGLGFRFTWAYGFGWFWAEVVLQDCWRLSSAWLVYCLRLLGIASGVTVGHGVRFWVEGLASGSCK